MPEKETKIPIKNMVQAQMMQHFVQCNEVYLRLEVRMEQHIAVGINRKIISIRADLKQTEHTERYIVRSKSAQVTAIIMIDNHCNPNHQSQRDCFRVLFNPSEHWYFPRSQHGPNLSIICELCELIISVCSSGNACSLMENHSHLQIKS